MKLNKYLKAVQALQAKNINRPDIKMFQVETRNYEDGETSIWVTTNLQGSEDYPFFVLYTFNDQEKNDAVLADLKAWLNVE